MRTIVCTTGTSIAQRVDPYLQERDGEERYAEAIRSRLKGLKAASDGNVKEFLKRASAESNSLSSLGASDRDHVILLHTETPDGEVCARELHRLLADEFSIEAELRRIAGLQVVDAQRFRREGIQHLFLALDDACGPQLENPEAEVFLNVTGGFKSVVPYVTLYGLLKRLPVVYIFELSNALITLPPAPVNFDYERLSRATDALAQLQKEGVLPREDFFCAIPGLAYHERPWYETLLEEDKEGFVTLSAFGLLLTSTLIREQAQVLLSPSARSAYESCEGLVREQFTFMLERVRDPLWRHGKSHSFQGTDLQVFKPGNTDERIACIVRGGRVYVCELLRHGRGYERGLPDKRQSDYDLSTFTGWTRPADVPPPAATEEEALRMLYRRWEDAQSAWELAEQSCAGEKEKSAALENRLHQLEWELEEARNKCSRIELAAAELEECRRQLEECRRQVAELQVPWWRRVFRMPRK